MNVVAVEVTRCGVTHGAALKAKAETSSANLPGQRLDRNDGGLDAPRLDPAALQLLEKYHERILLIRCQAIHWRSSSSSLTG